MCDILLQCIQHFLVDDWNSFFLIDDWNSFFLNLLLKTFWRWIFRCLPTPKGNSFQFFTIFSFSSFFVLVAFFSLCFIVVFILFSCSVFFLPDVHIAESHINWLVLRAATGGFMGPCYMVIKFCWVMKHLYTCSCVLYILWVFWCSPGDWFLLLREHGKIVTMTEF